MTTKTVNIQDFRKLSPEAKELVQWQAMRLKNKGYTFAEIARTLGVQGQTVSKWWKAYKASKTARVNGLIKDTFTTITVEMKQVVSKQAKQLLEKEHKHSEIADTLGVSSVAVLKKWLQPKLKEKSSAVKKTVFLQVRPDESIQVDRNTKLIKAKDYAHYYDATELLQAAKNTLEQSKIEIIEMQSQAKNDAKVAIDGAFEKAYEEGLIKANEQLAQTNIETALAAEKYLSTLQNSLPDIILDIVRKFIDDYNDTDFVIHNINSSLKTLRTKQKIELHVNDTVIKKVTKRLAEVNYPKNKLTLIPDSTLDSKDCLVITKLGIVNACLETQLQKIEAGIRA